MVQRIYTIRINKNGILENMNIKRRGKEDESVREIRRKREDKKKAKTVWWHLNQEKEIILRMRGWSTLLNGNTVL